MQHPALNGLNPPQKQAVLHVEGPLLVLAGAGSGKTRVIIEKIAHLIHTGRYPAKRIAAITFTNKSAREMRERVAKRIRGDAAQELTISTFHALGLRILQIDHAKLGLRRGFSIFDADDSASQVKDLLGPGTTPDAIDAMKQLISRAKNAGLSPEQAAAAALTGREREAAALYARYQQRLAAFNAVDFDDLIRLPVQLLETDADAVLGEVDGGRAGLTRVLNAVRAGAAAIQVSNHGGRQLDTVPGSFTTLRDVVDAVGDKVPVYLDGGVRRGSDIAKALALGADAVLLGRAPLYGLASRGPQGVAEVLTILRSEFEIALRLLGANRATSLDASSIRI